MTGEEKGREIVVSRTIEAPRDLVFEAHSEVRHLSKWFGPTGFTTTTHSFEFRTGGVWDYTMHGPDGTDYPNHVEYLEISPPERIVMRHGTRKDDPEAFVSTVTFDERAGNCEVTLRSVFKTKALRDRAAHRYHAVEGAKQTLSRLDTYLERTGRTS
ncbi:MAG: SRPBCC domain-containing protein [Acidimicrobiia bacterium]